MEAGAWPFLVGGVICLVKSDNERDLILLNSSVDMGASGVSGSPGMFGVPIRCKQIYFLERLLAFFSQWKIEAKTGL